VRTRDYIPRRWNDDNAAKIPLCAVLLETLHREIKETYTLAFPSCTTKLARSTGATHPFEFSLKTEREQCEHVILRMSRLTLFEKQDMLLLTQGYSRQKSQ